MKNIKGYSTLLPLLLLIVFASFRYLPLPGYQVGDKAKDFKLKNIDGKMVSLGNENTKGAIVVFTCNHCPFSQAYENRIIDLHNKYAAKGYPVVAINSNDKEISPDDSFEGMIERAQEHNYPFPYLYDETQEVATSYGAARTPHVFIVEKVKTDYVIRYIGAIDDNTDNPEAVTKHYVNDAVDALIAGKEVAVKTTKAIGCTIKWKKAN